VAGSCCERGQIWVNLTSFMPCTGHINHWKGSACFTYTLLGQMCKRLSSCGAQDHGKYLLFVSSCVRSYFTSSMPYTVHINHWKGSACFTYALLGQMCKRLSSCGAQSTVTTGEALHFISSCVRSYTQENFLRGAEERSNSRFVVVAVDVPTAHSSFTGES